MEVERNVPNKIRVNIRDLIWNLQNLFFASFESLQNNAVNLESNHVPKEVYSRNSLQQFDVGIEKD